LERLFRLSQDIGFAETPDLPGFPEVGAIGWSAHKSQCPSLMRFFAPRPVPPQRINPPRFVRAVAIANDWPAG
jgi:hypothetical protein